MIYIWGKPMNGDLLTRVINVTNHLLLPGWSSEYCSLRGDKNKPLGEEHDMKNDWLVVWNMTFIFPSIGNVIIPTDFHICQRGWNHQPEDVRFSTRGKGFQRKLLVPPSVHHWNPLKSRIALNCLENFGIIKHGWKIWGNWQRSHPHFSFWNPRPGPKIPTSSRWWWAVAVSQFAVSWGDPGKMGVWENLKIARKHGGIFFSDGNMSVSFSYPKKVSESVSYFIYGDNHYQ